jgi:protein-disulfide isomerase
MPAQTQGTGWLHRVAGVLNVVIVLVAVSLLLAPQGVFGRHVSAWRQQAVVKKQIRALWPALVHGPRVDDHRPVEPLLVVFADYQCAACRAAHFALLDMDGEAFGTVYRHAPSPGLRPMSELAARAAICAEEQDRFAAMHAWLNGYAAWERGPADWPAVAEEVGVRDVARFKACLSSERTGQRLAADQAFATQLAVTATPTFVGRGGVHVGVPTWEKLQRILH